MSDDRGTKARARWDRARVVAEVLGIGVKVAWVNLKALEDAELVGPISEKIPEAIELAQEIIVQPRNIDFRAKAQDVKLILWAFDKIGDVERIKIAYAKAMTVIE